MKLSLYCVCWVVFVLMMGIDVSAQEGGRLLKAANTLYDNFDYERAIELYKDVLIEDNSEEAKLRLAQCYLLLGNFEQTAYWYKLLTAQQTNNYDYKLAYAQVLQRIGNYSEAKKWYLDYAKYDVWGEKLAKNCDLIPNLRQKVANYEISIPSFNSNAADFSPIALDNQLIFVSNRSKLSGSVSPAAHYNGFLDFYEVSKQPGFVFGVPQRIKSKVNGDFNDGPASFCKADSMFYFSRNSATSNGKKVKTANNATLKTTLYTARYDALGRFNDIQPFPFNNPDYSFSYPAIAPDGQTLYFASDMPGGIGGMDLYVCAKIDTFWSQPINLGAEVNTPGNEVFPYIANDGTLYFASDGQATIGGYDIFMCQRQQGKWSNVNNMGLPFNSAYDDFSFWIDNTKEYGYFASNRPGGMGFDDVYRFQIPGYMEALAVVIDTVNIAPPVDTNVEKVFIIDQPVIDNPIINKTIGMNKVSFKSGDWKLNAEAQLELDKVVKFLKENPEVSVELGAHTDARGDDFVNYEISQKRAEAAREYIFLEGVPANQIVTKGYGENEILNECYNNVTCTDAQHQQNNRLNVKVLTVKGTAVTVTNPPPYESIVEPIKNTPAIQEFPLPDGSTVPPPPMTPLDTTTVILPTPADTLPPMQFKIIIGPYSTIDNTTYYTFAELNTPISTNQVGNDNFILLGPYPTIGEAEGMTQKVKALGGKTKVVAYTKEGYESLLSIKKLKKMGYK